MIQLWLYHRHLKHIAKEVSSSLLEGWVRNLSGSEKPVTPDGALAAYIALQKLKKRRAKKMHEAAEERTNVRIAS